ncbi:LOW QUALITY PROTEIN: protein phosphatase Slingshot homolog 3 [Rhinatrema bivittatum]|uniref:LOW QUALITY PROTEIN: protein phosphatase Slingshot homolog 3 n=1 Tax=Rhinatrema bivittatum TaxID=194408 RepID=UPI00112AF0E6|nr:LOW QUALITY PROTEIN: protein phosphatase Slingshot homolog 3 [Rhinatrema bivittatum]
MGRFGKNPPPTSSSRQSGAWGNVFSLSLWLAGSLGKTLPREGGGSRRRREERARSWKGSRFSSWFRAAEGKEGAKKVRSQPSRNWRGQPAQPSRRRRPGRQGGPGRAPGGPQRFVCRSEPPRAAMALITVHRSPSGSPHGTPTALKDEERSRRSRMQRRHSFVMVKGAALLLQEEEEPDSIQAIPPPSLGHKRSRSAQTQDQQQRCHLQAMVGLLRPQDDIRLAVRLESVRAHRIRYLLVVSTLGSCGEDETILLGVNFPSDGCSSCTIGMVLPLWCNTQVFLDGDGGFSVTSAGETRIFKPISVQTMWSMMQVLHKACESALLNNHFPGGCALEWAYFYESTIASDQSCINEWKAMSDLESVRPDSPAMFADQPTEGELTERMIRAKLREIMMTKDLENITSKEIRNELEKHANCNLKDYKEFIDNEMLLILAQMDRPSRIFDYLYLGSEWNASNLEELQRNGVGHILNVTREIDNFFPESLKYLNIRVYDEEQTDLLQHWKETYRFISSARKLNSKVLVHCKMGVSRSASTVIAYAMKEYSWTLEEAVRHVKEKRPIVQPNPGFMRQLLTYQGILDASKQRHSHLWERKDDYNPLESPGDVAERVINQLEDGFQTGETTWYDQPSPEEEEEEESPASPPYCFRPLKDVPEELESLTESPEGLPEGPLLFPPERPDSPLHAAIHIQGPEEMGSSSDDSLAEEVRGHLPSARLEESQVWSTSSSLSVPSPLTPRRHRINLWSVMRSISEMESQEVTAPLPAAAAAARDPAIADHPGDEIEVFGSLPRAAPEGMSCSCSDGHPGTPGSSDRTDWKLGPSVSRRNAKKASAPPGTGRGGERHAEPRATGGGSRAKVNQADVVPSGSGESAKASLGAREPAEPAGRQRGHGVLQRRRSRPAPDAAPESGNTEAAEQLAARPRLLHLQSVAELKAAALVSRQAKAFEKMTSPPGAGGKKERGSEAREDGRREGEPGREPVQNGRSTGQPEREKGLDGSSEAKLEEGRTTGPKWSSEGQPGSETRQHARGEGEPKTERGQNESREGKLLEGRETGQNGREGEPTCETRPNWAHEGEPEGAGGLGQNGRGKVEPGGKETSWNQASKKWAPLQLASLAEEQVSEAQSGGRWKRPELPCPTALASSTGAAAGGEADLANNLPSVPRLERTASGGRRMVRQGNVDTVEPSGVLAPEDGTSSGQPTQAEGKL